MVRVSSAGLEPAGDVVDVLHETRGTVGRQVGGDDVGGVIGVSLQYDLPVLDPCLV